MQDSGSFFHVCKEYFSNTAMLPLFVIAVVWLWKKWNTEKKQVFLSAGIISVLGVFNVVTYYIIGRVGEGETYYRFFWICPIALFVAMMLSDVLVSMKKEQRMLIVLTMFVGYFAFSSRPLTNWINIPENVYQVSDDVIEVSDAIMDVTDGAYTMIIDNNNLRNEVRQYNAKIGYTEAEAETLSNMLHMNDMNYFGREVMYYMWYNNARYIVSDKQKPLACRLVESVGLDCVAETENYYIYAMNHARMTMDEEVMHEMQNKIGVNINMEYIRTSETVGMNEFIYITDFGMDRSDAFYQEIVNEINAGESQFVIVNSQEVNQKVYNDLEVPCYCNNQDIQVIERNDYNICLINNENGISDEVMQKFQVLKNNKIPILLVLSKEISETEQIYLEVMDEDSKVLAVLTGADEGHYKKALGDRVLQYSVKGGDDTLITIMRLKGLEVE